MLVQFLRNDSERFPRGGGDKPTKIYILDSCDGSLNSQVFTSLPIGEVDSEFVAALEDHPPSSKTRLVMVQGGLLGETNGAFIDALSWHYRLDPLFLCTHLRRCEYWNEGRRKPLSTLPVALYSENDYIKIFNKGLSHTTAQILRKNGLTTGEYGPEALAKRDKI